MSQRCLPACLLSPVLLVLLITASSCRPDGPFHKETIRVSGQVFVDGQPPGASVQIMAHESGGMDKEHPSVTQAITENDGKFSMTTYETGDGMPPGEYVLTFTWQEFNVFSMSYGGPDKLNDRYNDPQKSEVKVFVKSGGKPIDLGEIKLTTE